MSRNDPKLKDQIMEAICCQPDGRLVVQGSLRNAAVLLDLGQENGTAVKRAINSLRYKPEDKRLRRLRSPDGFVFEPIPQTPGIKTHKV